jgi:hypothetical protein
MLAICGTLGMSREAVRCYVLMVAMRTALPFSLPVA